jgi:hypothetical protein
LQSEDLYPKSQAPNPKQIPNSNDQNQEKALVDGLKRGRVDGLTAIAPSMAEPFNS